MTDDNHYDDDETMDTTYIKALKTAQALEFSENGLFALVASKKGKGKQRRHRIPARVEGNGRLVVGRSAATRAVANGIREGDVLHVRFSDDGDDTLDLVAKRASGTKRVRERTYSWRFDRIVAPRADEDAAAGDEEDDE